MHWRSYQDREFLGHWSLEKNGQYRDAVVTIARVGGGLVKSAEKPHGDKCVILHFAKVTKPMVCNSTNCKTIETMYGPDVEGWKGKDITLYVADVADPKKRGATIKGLRVRPRRPTTPGEQIDEPARSDTNEDEQSGASQGEPGEAG